MSIIGWRCHRHHGPVTIGAGMLVSVSSNDDTWPRGWSSEQEAQLQTGPNDLALSWLKTVDCDHPYAWALLTPDFRTTLAQQWIIANPSVMDLAIVAGMSRDDLAQSLSAESPTSELFPQLLAVSCRTLRTANRNADLKMFVPSHRPRPIGPGLELVLLYHSDDLTLTTEDTLVFEPGHTARMLPVLFADTPAGWRVAGLRWLPRPGWPPTFDEVATADD